MLTPGMDCIACNMAVFNVGTGGGGGIEIAGTDPPLAPATRRAATAWAATMCAWAAGVAAVETAVAPLVAAALAMAAMASALIVAPATDASPGLAVDVLA
jgi:hypothetical protein